MADLVKFLFAPAIVAPVALFAPAAAAQVDPVGVAESEAEDAAIDDGAIVVTARRRAERLDRTPDSIIVFNEQAIVDAGIEDVGDVALLTPNVSFANDQEVGVSTLTIRGVSQVRNGEPPVAFVVDGVQAANSLVVTQEFFDVEQIEVLKGPQGALYGRNAIAGAVIVKTPEPTNEFAFKGQATIAEGDDYSIAGAVSGPIVADKLLFRVSANYHDREGQLTNIVFDEKVDFLESYAIRGKLVALPSDRVEIDLRAMLSRTDGGAGYFVTTETSPLNGADTVRKIASDSIADSTVNFESYSARLSVDLGGLNLTSVTAFDDIRAPNSANDDPRRRYDIDGAAGSFIQVSVQDESETFTQELRLSKDDGPIRFVVGGFYQSQDRDRLFDVFGNFTFFGTGNPDPDDAVFGQIASNAQELEYRGWGIFGQADIDLTEKLQLTLAGRYDEEKRKDLAQTPELSAKFTKFQPKVSLTYKPTERFLAYATYGVGFRPGGFNNTDTFGRTFAPETLKNYEIGVKGSAFDRLFQFEAAAFRMDYTNLQSFVFDNINGTQAIVNAKTSRIEGFEALVTSRPVSGLLLQAGFGYTDGVLKELGQVPGLQFPVDAFDGNVLKNTPEYNVNFVAQYKHELANGNAITGRGEFIRTGRTYWELDNVDSRDPYNIVNLRLTYDLDVFAITAFASNVFDKRYDEYFFAKEFVGGLVDIAWPSRPRQFGVQARVNF